MPVKNNDSSKGKMHHNRQLEPRAGLHGTGQMSSIFSAYTGTYFAFCRGGLGFLTGFRSSFLLFNENRYHSSNKHW